MDVDLGSDKFICSAFLQNYKGMARGEERGKYSEISAL